MTDISQWEKQNSAFEKFPTTWIEKSGSPKFLRKKQIAIRLKLLWMLDADVIVPRFRSSDKLRQLKDLNGDRPAFNSLYPRSLT